VAEAGSWKYAFIYDIAARHYPSLPQQARRITEARARQKLLEVYFLSVGVARRRDVLYLFGWPPALADRTIQQMEKSGFLTATSHPKQNGEWFALPSLCR
jgi:hypothetical protein